MAELEKTYIEIYDEILDSDFYNKDKFIKRFIWVGMIVIVCIVASQLYPIASENGYQSLSIFNMTFIKKI